MAEGDWNEARVSFIVLVMMLVFIRLYDPGNQWHCCQITIVSHFLFMSHLTFTISHPSDLMEASSLIINLLFDLEHRTEIQQTENVIA